MYTVYVLQSDSTNKIYIGYTGDLGKRLRQHNTAVGNKTSYTHRNKGPWKVVYSEIFETRDEAMSREKQLKSSGGRSFVHKQISSMADPSADGLLS